MQLNDLPVSRARRIAGEVLIFLGGLLLLGAGVAKLAHVPKVVSELTAHGFGGERLVVIGALEVACALLFITRFTRSMGFLLVSAYLGGAIATHVGHGTPWIPPAVMLSLLWVGVYLRHPVILWSFGPVVRDDGRGVPSTVAVRGS